MKCEDRFVSATACFIFGIIPMLGNAVDVATVLSLDHGEERARFRLDNSPIRY